MMKGGDLGKVFVNVVIHAIATENQSIFNRLSPKGHYRVGFADPVANEEWLLN